MPPTQPRPTLKDIARLSQCSTAVVSTVVNNAKGNTAVSDETRKRVEDVARQLGYRAHFASRTLKEQRSRTIGIYYPPNPWSGAGYGYEGRMIAGVEMACREAGHDLLVVNLTGNEPAKACIDKFAESRIDGLVLMNVNGQCDWLPQLLRVNSNIVAVDYAGDLDTLHATQFDNQQAVRIAVEHLASLGHQRIGYIMSCGEAPYRDKVLRGEAFKQVITDMGLATDPRLFFDAQTHGRTIGPGEPVSEIEASAAAQHFLGLGQDRPTAVLVYNDLTATILMQELMSRGLSVPRDMSVMGIDNSELCRRIYPTLTSIEHPLLDMGYAAAKFLIQQSDPAQKTRPHSKGAFRQTFAPELVARDSTSACP